MFGFRSTKTEAARHLLVQNETRGTTLADHADIADYSAARMKGLLGRDSLATGEGIWIVPCQSVHGWGMRFSIDLVYLDRKKRVRKVRREMKPMRISVCWLAHSVLELPVGTIDQSETRRGDQLLLTILPTPS